MRLMSFLSALALACASMKALAVQAEWFRAVEEMRNYCVAEVCMGMTMDEVASLPGGRFDYLSPELRNGPADRSCSGKNPAGANASFVSKDGTNFNLEFWEFPGPGETRKRFRVRSVALYVDADPADLLKLFGTLTRRYGMQPLRDDSLRIPNQRWGKNTTLFDAKAALFVGESPRKSLLNLVISSPRYSEWIESQPECHSQRKPLPKL